VPANAIAGMLNPFIAELVYAGETARLNALLQTATRWLIVASVPVYLVLLLVPDVVLSIYDEAYAVSASSLVLLTAGQIVNTICAPAMRLIPMSGRSLLNLGNALAALALSALLCWFFIPRWGAWGASLATATSLTLWSSWRVVEVWWLLGCFPFDRRAGGLLALAATGWALVRWGVGPEHPLLRIGGTAVVILVFLIVAFTAARSPEDEAVLGRVRAGLRRRLGRPAGKN
jgi:O-antigen/teichoic acid export membrane protein